MQAAHHQIRDQLPNHMPHTDRIGTRRIQDGTFGDFHLKRRQARPIIRDFRGDHAFDAKAGIGAAIGGWHIDAAAGKPRSAGIIHHNPIRMDGHGGLQRHRRLIAIRFDIGTESATGQLGDFKQGRAAAGFKNILRQIIQAIHRELVHHFNKSLGTGVIAGAKGIDIAFQFDRRARSCADEIKKRLIRRAGIEAFHDRDIEPFFENAAPFRAHAKAANINDMRGIGEKPDNLAATKGGRDHGQVMQMPGREPRVIGDVVITWLHAGGGEFRQEVAHRFRHGIHMARRAGYGLGQHAPLQVKDAGGKITRFAHRGAEGSADHGLRLFFHHRDQAIPLDLALNCRQRAGFLHRAASCVRSR